MGTDYQGTHFEWDDAKAEANIANHRVTFLEAATVFCDPLSVIYDDDEHSGDEQRYLTVGCSASERLLIVCYTERADVVRLISAREATPKEVRDYEEGEG